MLSKLLLPHYLQKIGWLILVPFSLLLFSNNYFDFNFSFLEFEVREGGLFEDAKENFTNELALIGVFVSLFLIAFSREKEEDEYIQKLRLDSLLLAFYANTFILIIGTLVFYGFGYLEFMGYNMFTIQLIFILRFRWVLFQQKKYVLAL
ncbi:hypothetical protein DFQ04_1066 [Algoriphagus boseongensis]|uniref:Uncharacterized protein n=1 Tax=Algoriphagus boseongensis TaxID=1442587 RepID=A0A4R6TC26_9BACT|nr:hypothetical protein [Algoriphagus boseongensis]TDQ19245.1 hypothetical protein DFQ04_1066 [Algoriphagus boseongensis]